MKKIDKFHRHEMVDRCTMVCDIIDECLLGHPALSKSMTRSLEKAQGIIYKVSCTACDTYCKKCGLTALATAKIKGKKRDVCLNCFHDQKPKKYKVKKSW